ncbi:hypothetical protein [Flavobacterium sp.]|jgi:hypothetical protein|uniref:hypothetical protein n=1 Tax=Flavobacterium sp. TaxID=239 RepID=UPI0037BF1130
MNVQNALSSRDGNENLFSFLLPSSASGNKKEKNCSGQRDNSSYGKQNECC